MRSSYFVLAATVVGCAAHHGENVSSDDSALLAQDGTDANEVETQTSALTAAFTLGTPTATAMSTPDTLVTNADRASSYFLPSNCLTVKKDATNRKVTYTLDTCSGPWGLFRVSGTVVATYSQAPGGGIQIDVDGTGLKVNRATADYHAAALITASGLDRTMTWNGQLTGLTARGRAFERSASWTVTWSVGGSCVTIDGEAKGTVLKRSIDTKVEKYVRCRGECPEAGGLVTVTDSATNERVSLSFDGTNEAKLTTSGGTTTQIALACGL